MAKLVERLLFIRTDRLGETLLNLPTVVALKAALPAASITLLADPSLHPLLQDAYGVDRLLGDEPRSPVWWVRAFRLSRTLRPLHFDAAIVSNPKKEFHLAVWLAGIPVRIGYDRKWGFLLSHRLRDRKALGERHEVEYNLELVRVLGLPTTVPQWRLPRFEQEQAEALHLIARQGIDASQPFIAVHPWTSHPSKQWPPDRFRTLIRMVAERRGVGVVVIGGMEAQAAAAALLSPGLPIANLVGRLTLRQLAGLLQRARVLVSNDSGPVHLAAAVNARTLVLFGSTSDATGPRRWGPWGQGHVVICKPSMEAITVDEVFAALHHMLEDDR